MSWRNLAVSGRVRIRRLPGEELTGPAPARRRRTRPRASCGRRREAALGYSSRNLPAALSARYGDSLGVRRAGAASRGTEVDRQESGRISNGVAMDIDASQLR